MRLQRIELEGFLSHRDRTVVDLSDVGAAAIVGPNGAGKSSLVEAVTWALWGRGRGRGPDEMVNPESTRAEVVVTFDLGGRRYRVKRERTVGKTPRSALSLERFDGMAHDFRAGSASPAFDVDVSETWLPLGHPNIVDTERAIVDLLGMDADTFEATSYIGQGRADAFTRLRPAERKRLLGEVLELERYRVLAGLAGMGVIEAKDALGSIDVMREVAIDRAARRDEVAESMERTARERDDARARVEDRQADAEEATAASVRAAEAVAASRVALGRTGAVEGRLRGVQAEYDGLRLDLDRLREVIESGVPAVDEGLEALAEAEALGKVAEEIAQAFAAGESMIATLDERRRGLASELAAVSVRRDKLAALAGVCPTCEQPIDEAVISRLEDGLAEDEANLEAGMRDASEDLAGHHAEQAQRAERWTQAVEATHEARTRALNAQERAYAAQRAKDEVTKIGARMGALAPTVAELQAELEALADVPDIEEAERRSRQASLDAEGARVRLSEAMTHLEGTGRDLGALEESLRRITEAEELLAKLEVERREAVTIRDVAELAARAFGRDGIPALLIETAIPEIEAEANELLELLTGGRLTVALETLGAKKSGGVRETLDITVGDDVSERALEALSGGERQMVDLSLRIALSKTLAARRGRQIESLIIDEGFTALDSAHRQRTIEAFAGLARTFPLVLTITHLAEIAEAFGTRFVVERAGGTSVVRREG